MKRVFLVCMVLVLFGMTALSGCKGSSGDGGPAGQDGIAGPTGTTGTTGPAGPTLPSVTSVDPAQGNSNVPLDAVIRATFSTAMTATTLTTSTFTVSSAGVAIAGTVSYNSGSKTAYFDPTSPLPGFSYISVTLTTGVQDTNGNGLAQNHSWSFYTGGSFAPSTLYVSNRNSSSLSIFNNAGATKGNVAPDRTFGGGASLSQPWYIWYDSAADRLYVPGEGSGNVVVFNNASTRNGTATVDRTIDSPTFSTPTGQWFDAANDRLYVAGFSSDNIVVYNNASTINGTVAPDRIISSGSSTLNGTFSLWLDSATDSLYVISRGNNSILVYNNAATIDGIVQPDRIISGPTTSLSMPESFWLDSGSNQLYVSNRTGSTGIVVFNNASTVNGDVAPSRSIPSGGLSTLNTPVGMWFDAATNRLYVANRNANSIVVFSGASSMNGDTAPARTISGGNTLLNAPVSVWLDTSP